MAKTFGRFPLLVLVVLSISISYSEQLQSSQTQTLLRIQALLNFPDVLSSWNNDTDFCNSEQTSSVTVGCYEDTITQLHIIGNPMSSKAPLLPSNFSIDSFVTTLVKLPSLKVLTLVSLGLWGPLPVKIARLSSLEILNITSNSFHGAVPLELSSLKNLQTLILDDNMFTGRLPHGLGSLSLLAVMSMKKNFLTGPLPDSLGSLINLRVLVLSHNHFLGEVPDISGLTNLQVLELEDNSLGPQFPQVGDKIVRLVLRKNKFTSSISDAVHSYFQLQWLDVSLNRFVGPFPTSLLSLPSIMYLNIEGNRFTGMLSEDLPCNAQLQFVDLSTNLLTGRLPSCLLSDSNNRDVLYTGNCLAMEDGDSSQHPVSFCRNEALAVGILPHHKKPKKASRAVLASTITGGIIGGLLLVGLAFLVVRRVHSKNMVKSPPTRLIAENALSTGYTSKLLSDARYVSQAMKIGALGISAYRAFSLEELEEATNRFNTTSFMGEGSPGQMYRGQLKDGSHVAIRCLKMKKSHSTQSFMHHVELISKLRHQHLVCSIGHCFEYYLDDSSVSRIFLIFESVPNGTLRDWISGRHGRLTLTWSQRIAAAIGVAKGIQFLHTGFVPGVFSNNLKITDILLDHNLVAKICSYNLPLLAENMRKVGNQGSSSGIKEVENTRVKHQEKCDIFDFGVILLEIIMGRPLSKWDEVETAKDQFQASITADDAAIKRLVDPAVRNASSDQALKPLTEICTRCLQKNPSDRPSIEDVLWNLQFAAQVQDASHSNGGSPIMSSSRSSGLHLTVQ